MGSATPSRPALRSHGAVLRAKIDLTCTDLWDAFDELWSHPDLARLFPSFLILLHQIMRGSVPLMEAAHGRALELSGQDPVSEALARYLAVHIREERDHDVWTLEDLAAAGLSTESVLSRPPSPSVAALVGAQYYWILHHHPVGLLGYIAVLEGSPPSEAHIERLKLATALPDEVFRTYAFHGRVDPHHSADLDRALDGLPLTRAHSGLIGMSAAHTGRRLAECLRELEPLEV